ncbi:MAG TPA: DUF1028 domain-containing protein [Bryobacteraceae bacterium]|nr:DUF1028 domain-containing protein [Bryobacteraceae bacterium]
MRILLLCAALALAAPALPAQQRPVHTYSIVARDATTGEIGVAVQSHWFSVGALVAWAEPGAGAVATQSFVDPSYGPLGIELMRAGKDAPSALKALLLSDPDRDSRQVAMVDAKGTVAVHTGAKCIPAAGHMTGNGFSVQANLMEKATVWPAMARAFESAKGDLADRMIAALEAAEREGGDIRGRQSAAILIVGPRPSGTPWNDRIFDLMVEDHPQPVAELKRLISMRRAYRHMDAGDACATAKDWPCAAREYGAAERLLPGNAEVVFWHAAALATGGKVDDSLPLFRRVFAQEPKWAELVRRLPGVDLLPKDPRVMERILSVR